jgi:hypothetical protein
MELWIRSQDKEKFLPIDKPIVYDFSEFGSHRIIYKESASYVMNLGSYKSKERALEVLDEIQEVINNGIQESKYDSVGNRFYKVSTNKKVYEMPED